MKDTEFNDLLEDLKAIGHFGPLTRFGQDLNDIDELPAKGYMKGARVFFDPKTNVRYVSSPTGYVRRYVPTTYFGRPITSRYTLNQRKKQEKKIIGDRKWTSGVFVLLMEEEARIELIVRGIRNYRNTLMITLKK
jgi:hypothetical protein